nr:MAG TPA: hypothetical protein [Caudoviricetes sp.]
MCSALRLSGNSKYITNQSFFNSFRQNGSVLF